MTEKRQSAVGTVHTANRSCYHPSMNPGSAGKTGKDGKTFGGIVLEITLRPYVVVPAALIAIVLLATGVIAAIPSADGTIVACRNTSSGALRVIDGEVGETCKSNEEQLTWDSEDTAGYRSPRLTSDGTGPIPPGETREKSRNCAPDEHFLDGGYLNFGPSKIQAANPFIGVPGDSDAVGFRVRATNNTAVQDDNGITVYALCVRYE